MVPREFMPSLTKQSIMIPDTRQSQVVVSETP